VVLPANISAEQDFSKKPLDPESQKGRAFKALQNVLEWNGLPAPDDLDLGEDAIVALIEDWKEEFYANGKQYSNKRQVFHRVMGQLAESRYIEKNEKYVWLK